MFRRLLLQDLYRVRGNMFGRLHTVGLASHIRNGNFVEVCSVEPTLTVDNSTPRHKPTHQRMGQSSVCRQVLDIRIHGK
jgi:hypothetical protein